MRVIDLREQFVVYVIYSGEGKWSVSYMQMRSLYG